MAKVQVQGEDARAHLRALLADWQLLADLSFCDLILWQPVRTEGSAWPTGHQVVAQIRPSTGPTAFAEDLIGRQVAWGDRPLIDAALGQEEITRDRDASDREVAIPVLFQGRAIAVITQHSSPTSVRTPSRLESVYLQTANDLAAMIAAGAFPESSVAPDAAVPRVGDGLIRLDIQGQITYASPNAASALRRLGGSPAVEGSRLGEVIAAVASDSAPTDEGWSALLSGRAARVVSVSTSSAVVDFRVIPLMPGRERIGALVLVHDVTEINRRDRELITKTATIREIHHRVKNNLQTVAALLRLQARRVDDDIARAALEEAVRRVGSIAVVHETLSAAGSDDDVAFDEVADRVIEMLSQVAARPGVRVERHGSFGDLPSSIATALSMVLNELISNALEHGVAESGTAVAVSVDRDGSTLRMRVSDDGVGLPEDFITQTSLGLEIVRTLVEGELRGRIDFLPAQQGTEVVVEIPL